MDATTETTATAESAPVAEAPEATQTVAKPKGRATTKATTTKAKGKGQAATKAKPAAKAKATFGEWQCHWGGGSYGSPKSAPRCTAERPKDHPRRQLCDEHEAKWKIVAKQRAAAKAAERGDAPKVAKPTSAAKSKAVVKAAKPKATATPAAAKMPRGGRVPVQQPMPTPERAMATPTLDPTVIVARTRRVAVAPAPTMVHMVAPTTDAK